MKKMLVYFAALAASLPTFAGAYDFTGTDPSARFMLYMRVPLSLNDRKAAAPQFGLSFDRGIAYAANSETPMVSRPYVSIVDWQFNAPRSQALKLGGAAMLSSDGERSVWKSPWLWVGVGVAILGISCATDNFPCDDDSYGGGGSSGSGGGY